MNISENASIHDWNATWGQHRYTKYIFIYLRFVCVYNKKEKYIECWYVLFSYNNARDINFFTKFFTNCWCGEWLLVNKKVILMVGPDKNQ